MKTAAIIDYGMGNLDSVRRATEECGAQPIIAATPNILREANYIILPGVGVFKDAMQALNSAGFTPVLRDLVLGTKVPLLGICLGMQLLADTGTECGTTQGLGLIPGIVDRLKTNDPAERIPHVGWNDVNPVRELPLFNGIRTGCDFYFVHSYHFIPSSPGTVVARTPYCGEFVSCVGRENIVGTQFHPEKSQQAGLQLLRNFFTYY
jgi:glutamine amidotransferase